MDKNAYFPHLLSPLTLKGGLTIRNRTVMPAMHVNLTPHGDCTDLFTSFYKLRGAGGVGLIIVGGAQVDDRGGGEFMIRIDDDKYIDGLKKFTTEIKSTGASVAVQLYHAGRYAPSFFMGGKEALSASKTFSPITREWSQEMTKQDIEETLHHLYQCAQRARKAGFDAVEMLASAGYLVLQFLSPLTNHRSDEYGGTLENRMRFGREVLKAIKEGAEDTAVIVRFSGYDFVKGSSKQMETAAFAKALSDDGVELINLTGGWHEANSPQITYHLPEAGIRHLGTLIKSAVGGKTPITLANRIHSPELADKIIRNGVADAVAIGRPLLSDPNWIKKAASGEAETIIPCVSCNQECLDRVFEMKLVGCSLNPLAGKPEETDFLSIRTGAPKKILIAGAGPAGLYAAYLLANAGHDVTVYEKSGQIGGQIIACSNVPHKSGFMKFVEPVALLAMRAGAHIRLGKAVGEAFVEEIKPDVVVLATGAAGVKPPIPGADLPHVLDYQEVLLRDSEVGRRVAIIGGGPGGVEVALYLATRSAMSAESHLFFSVFNVYEPRELRELAAKTVNEITIVEMRNKIGEGIGKSTKWAQKAMLDYYGVGQMTNSKVVAIREGELELDRNGERIFLPADTVLLACGMKSRDELYAPLSAKGYDVRRIGDAAKPADIPAAFSCALELAKSLM